MGSRGGGDIRTYEIRSGSTRFKRMKYDFFFPNKSYERIKSILFIAVRVCRFTINLRSGNAARVEYDDDDVHVYSRYHVYRYYDIGLF